MSESDELVVANPLDDDPDQRCAAYRAMRAQGEVVPFPGLDGILAAVSYESVARGLSSVDDFGGSAGQEQLPEEDKHIAAISEPRHGKVRKIINSVVAFHKSQRIESYLGELCEDLVNTMLTEARSAGPQGVDLVEHLARPIPPAAITRLLGFPETDAALFLDWIRESGERFQQAAASGRSIAIADSNPQMRDHVDARIAERLATPVDQWPKDALSRFLSTEVDGERLDPRSIRAQIMFIIGAGTDTTRNAIGNLFYRLGHDPQSYAALRSDPSVVEAAVEEALRIDAPAQFMVRTCRRPTELGDRHIEPGQTVFMCIGAGNHDESMHRDPDVFAVDRGSRDHLSFGSGRHICPGAGLARMEIRIALRTFLNRVVRFHLADPVFHPMPVAMLLGPQTLPIIIDEEAPALPPQ
ncbi:cytochrome P450 [Mycobacterium intracellulare]|uniref:cytochrome P450 n=1 Tax=Mycobacterium intracellulare TaxID=1767 RepID=UPI001E4C8080|nr:cytochrome P450 [Mycobacterium intracellulare]UGT99213.1 cytochrome P450 [Mycobacterium intracellulare]